MSTLKRIIRFSVWFVLFAVFAYCFLTLFFFVCLFVHGHKLKKLGVAPRGSVFMCYQCWEESGMPKAKHPLIPSIVKEIRVLYDSYSATGGACRLVTDEWNVNDDDIDYCLRESVPQTADAGQREVERTILTYLKRLSVPQRYACLAAAEGWLEIAITSTKSTG